MKKLLLMLAAACLTLPLVAQTADAANAPQNTASGPPKLIQIYREVLKPGRSPLHEKSETQYANAMYKANFPYYQLALTSMSGPDRALFITAGNDYADLQKGQEFIRKDVALRTELDRLAPSDVDLVATGENLVYSYEPDLSYRPDFNLGEMRYATVDLFRVKPGYGDEFKDFWKRVIAAHEKANIDEHMLVYSLAYGGPTGAYLVIQPMKTVAELDTVHETHGAAYKEALGSDWQQKISAFAREGLTSVDNNLFEINPKMSYVSKQTIASAPGYWRPKETETAARAKKSIVTPASKKQETKQ